MKIVQKSNIIKLVRLLVLIGLFIPLLSGCKSYHLGSPTDFLFQSIYISPVTNHSYAPQAQAIISNRLREAFIQDARIKVVKKKVEADAILFVDLTEYERNATARRSGDTALADVFDVRLMANVSLFSKANNRFLFKDRAIQTATNVYTSNPYTETRVDAYQLSERQAMEQLARDISRKIANEVLSPW